MVDINSLFPTVEAVGIQVNIAFSNIVLTNSSGVEQRIIKWQDPIRSFNFTRKILGTSDITAIANFYDLTKGSNYSFLYKDRSDYLSNDQGYLYPAPNGTRKHFQVVKKYSVGNNIHYRPITQVNNLTSIKRGNTTLTGWTLSNFGQVSFTNAPAVGNPLKANFDFYVPVTFDSDEFVFKLINQGLFSVDRLLLKEIKQVPFIYPVDKISDTPTTGENIVTFPSNLDYLAENQGYSEYDTETVTLSSGFRTRTTRLQIPFFKQLFGARKTFNQSQIDALLNFWLANKANGAQFYYVDNTLTNQNVLARFNTQELTYTITSNNSVYSLNPLEIKLYRGNITPPLDQPMVAPSDILSRKLMTLARVCNINVPTTEPIVYGFTTSDRDITIDGQVYKANTAFEPTAYEQNASWAVNNQELKTVIDSSEITEAQLASGLFDNAVITVGVVDYLNPPNTLAESIVEQIGDVGEIVTSDTNFTMENLSRGANLLKQSVSIKTSPYCRYNFGDNHCTKNINDYTYTANIVVGDSYDNTKRYFNVDNIEIPNHILVAGYVLFTSGANANLQYMIFDNYYNAATDTTVIVLNVPAFFDVDADAVTLVGGCDKQFSTCKQLYNNAINFGGERSGGNFMPNNDFYVSSPLVQG
jgi:hypothetical protein